MLRYIHYISQLTCVDIPIFFTTLSRLVSLDQHFPALLNNSTYLFHGIHTIQTTNAFILTSSPVLTSTYLHLALHTDVNAYIFSRYIGIDHCSNTSGRAKYV